MNNINNKFEKATLAGGCFWCTEAIFQRLKGVVSVLPGYSGGNPPAGGEDPTYEQVSTGTTGHAETTQIEFDPKQISFEKILKIFWNTHDPTTLNRQGNDVGTQYRSVIFYRDERQKRIAEKSKTNLENSKAYSDPIVTEIIPYINFYASEDYHKNYYERHKDAPYCSLVIGQKIHKLLEEYIQDVKDEYKKDKTSY